MHTLNLVSAVSLTMLPRKECMLYSHAPNTPSCTSVPLQTASSSKHSLTLWHSCSGEYIHTHISQCHNVALGILLLYLRGFFQSRHELRQTGVSCHSLIRTGHTITITPWSLFLWANAHIRHELATSLCEVSWSRDSKPDKHQLYKDCDNP